MGGFAVRLENQRIALFSDPELVVQTLNGMQNLLEIDGWSGFVLRWRADKVQFPLRMGVSHDVQHFVAADQGSM